MDTKLLRAIAREQPKHVRQPCSACARARKFLPKALRIRLEELERRRLNPEAS